MADTAALKRTKKQLIKTLRQYVPIVDRVHGNNHPEFHEVRKVFDALADKVEQSDAPRLQQEFDSLRALTHGYQVPDDVCESFEAVYRMLSELDASYHE